MCRRDRTRKLIYLLSAKLHGTLVAVGHVTLLPFSHVVQSGKPSWILGQWKWWHLGLGYPELKWRSEMVALYFCLHFRDISHLSFRRWKPHFLFVVLVNMLLGSSNKPGYESFLRATPLYMKSSNHGSAEEFTSSLPGSVWMSCLLHTPPSLMDGTSCGFLERNDPGAQAPCWETH